MKFLIHFSLLVFVCSISFAQELVPDLTPAEESNIFHSPQGSKKASPKELKRAQLLKGSKSKLQVPGMRRDVSVEDPGVQLSSKRASELDQIIDERVKQELPDLNRESRERLRKVTLPDVEKLKAKIEKDPKKTKQDGEALVKLDQIIKDGTEFHRTNQPSAKDHTPDHLVLKNRKLSSSYPKTSLEESLGQMLTTLDSSKDTNKINFSKIQDPSRDVAKDVKPPAKQSSSSADSPKVQQETSSETVF